MKIFVYTSFPRDQQLTLKQHLPAGLELMMKPAIPEAEMKRSFQSAEIILGNPPVEWFENMPSSLKFWQLDSAGFDQYRHLRVNCPVANMGDFFARQCSETIVGGILSFYRGLNHLTRLQDLKKWDGKNVRSELGTLGDKNVLILGSGAIGLAVKKILSGFGCTIKTTARHNPIADFHTLEETLSALPGTSLVINTLPGTADHYVSSRFFDAMTRGSVYASIGRGNTTDERAMVEALRSGKLAGAILDVTETEPLPRDSLLWGMKNVILTQHTGGGIETEAEGILKQFIRNLNSLIRKEEIPDLVDLSRGY